jgi:hypothetical protein
VGKLLAAGGGGDGKAAGGGFYFARLAIPSPILHNTPASGKRNHLLAKPQLSH